MHSPTSSQPAQPLSLTVHSMPQPSQTNSAQFASTAAGRWKMLFILLVCAAPVLASYFTYYVVRPEGRRVYGELITPQRPLPAWPGTNLQGQTQDLTGLKGQWLLISVAGGACQQTCERQLYWQRQLRESLGKGKERLDWVWLVNDQAPIAPTLQPALRGATVLRVSADSLAQWLEPAPKQALSNHLYLVDPLGNWMMRFPAHMDAGGASRAKRDLERLLRAAASWDQPGR